MINMMESGDDSRKLMAQKKWSDGKFMEIFMEIKMCVQWITLGG